MKKILFAVLTLTLMASIANAEYGTIQCIKGDCEGWEASYEATDNKYKTLFKNISGKSAFNIKVLINMYDYFGDYLGRREFKVDGPIYERIPYLFIAHPKTSKNSYDIYWSDRDGKTPETVKGE